MSSNIENIAEQVGQLNKALENQYDILKALCADYISIYKIDFNTGKYEIYQTGNLHNKEIAEKTRSLNDYKELVRWYASEYVIQEDMDYFCNATSEETIMKHLLEKKAAISAHLSEAHSSVMQMYVTVELDTIIIAYRAKNCKRYSSGAVKTSVSGCFFSAACR